MGARENGLTLEGLAHKLEAQAQRLETLERENERMRSENAELRGRMAALPGPEEDESAHVRAHEGAPDYRFADDEERVSRRALIAKAGAAVAAGTLLIPREARADLFDNVVSRSYVIADSYVGASSYVVGHDGVRGYRKASGTGGVYGDNPNGYGFFGTGGIAGVYGEGDDGVKGFSNRDGFSGVYGRHVGGKVGPGVTGDGKGNWPGVWGRNPDADGVTGETSGSAKSGVYGRHNGSSGFGVTGDGKGANGVGVLGRNPSGYRGQFEGGKAQLKLKPAGSTGKPGGAHTKGEIYMDSAGALFVCIRGGNPATWRKVTTSAV